LFSVFKVKKKIFYGWIVLVSIIINGSIMMGINSSFGVFFKPLESTFNLTRASTSAILSVRMAASCISALTGGWVIDRYGPRVAFSIMGFFVGLSMILTGRTTSSWQLFITYSLLLAMGAGASYVVNTSTILHWFDKKRGLALGLAGSGGGLGVAFIAPLAAYFIDNFGWQTALLILGGITWLVIIPVSQLLKKDPYSIGALPDGVSPDNESSKPELETTSYQKVPLLRVIRTSNFWAFLFIWLLMAFSGLFIMTHIVPHSIDLGYSATESATILSLSGITMIAGRLFAGVITDKWNVKAIAIIGSLLQAATLLSLVWMQELWMLYLFGIIHGFAFGGFGTSVSVLIGRSFGLGDIGKILGALEVGIFIGAAIGPLLGGMIFDASDSYRIAFLIMFGTILGRIPLITIIKQGNMNQQ